MKTRPELITRSGKSNVLKHFFNNLRENDLHYENNKITQCVFLGVLKLKPVPSVFSSNTLSTSRPCSVDNNPQKVKKSSVRGTNKEYSKNINKVISGKVSKKNPEKIKASVKKVPSKKSKFIKVKLNMNKTASESSSTDELKCVTNVPDCVVNKPDDVRNHPRTLIASTSMQFNPVQNLFDKLKRKIDGSHGETEHQRQEEIFLNSFVADSSRNKLILAGVSRKSKHKPTTVNETDTNPSVNSLPDNAHTKISHFDNESPNRIRELFAENNPTKDVILIDSEPAQIKTKERTSPRFRRVSIMEGDKSKKYKNKTASSKNFYPRHNFETQATCSTSSVNVQSDIIVIDDDQNSNKQNKIDNDDVICLGATQEIEILSTKKKDTSCQNDVRIVPEMISSAPECVHNQVQKSSSEIITIEETSLPKLKSRRSRLLPAPIPSIFLQTPRLLRSELSQKSVKQIEKPPPKPKSSSKLSKSTESDTPNRSAETTVPKTPEKSQVNLSSPKKSKYKQRNEETIFVSEEIKSPNPGDKPSLKLIIRQRKKTDTDIRHNKDSSRTCTEVETVGRVELPQNQPTIPKMYISQIGNDISIVEKSVTRSYQKKSVTTTTADSDAVNKLIQDLTDDDVIEIPFHTKKKPVSTSTAKSPEVMVSSAAIPIIDVESESELSKQHTNDRQQSPRTSRQLRSNKSVTIEATNATDDLLEISEVQEHTSNLVEDPIADIITIPDDNDKGQPATVTCNINNDIIFVINEHTVSQTRTLRSSKQVSPTIENVPEKLSKSPEVVLNVDTPTERAETTNEISIVKGNDSPISTKSTRLLRSNNKSGGEIDMNSLETLDLIENEDIRSDEIASISQEKTPSVKSDITPSKKSIKVSANSSINNHNDKDVSPRLLRSTNKNLDSGPIPSATTDTELNENDLQLSTENEESKTATIKESLSPSNTSVDTPLKKTGLSDRDSSNVSTDTEPQYEPRLLRSKNSSQLNNDSDNSTQSAKLKKLDKIVLEVSNEQEPAEVSQVMTSKIVNNTTVPNIEANIVAPETNFSKSSMAGKNKNLQIGQKDKTFTTEFVEEPTAASKPTSDMIQDEAMNNMNEIVSNEDPKSNIEQPEEALQPKKKDVKKKATGRPKKKVKQNVGSAKKILTIKAALLEKVSKKRSMGILIDNTVQANNNTKIPKRLMKKIPKTAAAKTVCKPTKLSVNNKNVGNRVKKIKQKLFDSKLRVNQEIEASLPKNNELTDLQIEEPQVSKQDSVLIPSVTEILHEDVTIPEDTVIQSNDEISTVAKKPTMQKKLNKRSKKITNSNQLNANKQLAKSQTKIIRQNKVKKLKNAVQDKRHAKKVILNVIQTSKQNKSKKPTRDTFDSLQIAEIVNSIQAIEISEENKQEQNSSSIPFDVKEPNLTVDNTPKKRRGRSKKLERSNGKSESQTPVTQVTPRNAKLSEEIPDKINKLAPSIPRDKETISTLKEITSTRDESPAPTKQMITSMELEQTTIGEDPEVNVPKDVETTDNLEFPEIVSKQRRGRTSKQQVKLNRSSVGVLEEQHLKDINADANKSMIPEANEINSKEVTRSRKNKSVKLQQPTIGEHTQENVQNESHSNVDTAENLDLKKTVPKKLRARPSKKQAGLKTISVGVTEMQGNKTIITDTNNSTITEVEEINTNEATINRESTSSKLPQTNIAKDPEVNVEKDAQSNVDNTENNKLTEIVTRKPRGRASKKQEESNTTSTRVLEVLDNKIINSDTNNSIMPEVKEINSKAATRTRKNKSIKLQQTSIGENPEENVQKDVQSNIDSTQKVEPTGTVSKKPRGRPSKKQAESKTNSTAVLGVQEDEIINTIQLQQISIEEHPEIIMEKDVQSNIDSTQKLEPSGTVSKKPRGRPSKKQAESKTNSTVVLGVQEDEIINTIQLQQISIEEHPGVIVEKDVQSTVDSTQDLELTKAVSKKPRGRASKKQADLNTNSKGAIVVKEENIVKTDANNSIIPEVKEINEATRDLTRKPVKLQQKSIVEYPEVKIETDTENNLENTVNLELIKIVSKKPRGRPSKKQADSNTISIGVPEIHADKILNTDGNKSIISEVEASKKRKHESMKFEQTITVEQSDQNVQGKAENNVDTTKDLDLSEIVVKKRKARQSKKQPDSNVTSEVVEVHEDRIITADINESIIPEIINSNEATKIPKRKSKNSVKNVAKSTEVNSQAECKSTIPKKRRGRQKKLSESKEANEQKVEDNVSNTTETQLEKDVKTVLKKQNSRSKKLATSDGVSKVISDEKVENDNQKIDQQMNVSTVVKKRQYKSKKSVESKDHAKVNEQKETCWIDDAVPKKPRGRPKRLVDSADKSDTKLSKLVHNQMSVTQLKVPVKQKLYEEIPKKKSKVAGSISKVEVEENVLESTELIIEDDMVCKKDITVFDFEDEESQEPVQLRGKSQVSSTDNQPKKKKSAPRISVVSDISLKLENNTAKISSTLKSPMKQPTIMEMFEKVVTKQKQNLAKPLFDDEPPRKAPRAPSRRASEAAKDMPPPSPRLSKQDEYYEAQDFSDDDSRAEWIPEEYAEYKYKYTAKKLRPPHIYRCRICLRVFPTYHKLMAHKPTHKNVDNPYECQQCKESFKILEDFVAHLKVHKGEKPYVCKKCNEGFWKKEDYEKHIPIHILRRVKEHPKKFQCDLCGKAFVKLCDMDRHTRVHTGEKPSTCNICGKGFQQSHNLSKHLITHLHVRPYTCEICGNQFSRPDVLSRHLLTHAVEKPTKCSLCPKSFIRQSQLNVHLKHEHSNNADDTSQKADDVEQDKSSAIKTEKTPKKERIKVDTSEENPAGDQQIDNSEFEL